MLYKLKTKGSTFFNGHKVNATQNHLITYKYKDKMGGTTIFALAKMTTF